jgi:peptidoglycan/LPS O-acetylase OafA/YrhL
VQVRLACKDAGSFNVDAAYPGPEVQALMQAKSNGMAGGDHVRGIDSVRFIAALWVVFSHLGFAPIFQSIDRSTLLGFVLNGAMGVAFSGPAAVVVFFIISGFCIHYPFAADRPFAGVSYLIRRYLRVAPPMLVATAVADWAGLGGAQFFDAILWSLVAELMYYTLYPFLRPIIGRGKLDVLLLASYLVAFAIWLAWPGQPGFAVFGWQLNWLVCLPAWLLGVKLAEVWASTRTRVEEELPSRRVLWQWRLAVWAIASTCAALNFHSAIPFSLTMNLFAAPAYFWLVRELQCANPGGRASRTLEWAGTWSYSIYLCHMPVQALVRRYSEVASLSPLLLWTITFILVLAGSYAFYLAVEKPSHRIARWASRAALRWKFT